MNHSNITPPARFGRAPMYALYIMDFKSLLGELLVKQAPKTITASEVGVCTKSLPSKNGFFGEFVVGGTTITASTKESIALGATCLVSIHKALEDIELKSKEIITKGTVWATAVAQA